MAYLAITVGSGTRDEAETEHGVAHLVEHMLFKGTQKRTTYQVNNRLEGGGGELNAYTTKEETVVHATCLKSDYLKALDLLTDMIFNSKYPPSEIDRERNVIIDEINSYKDAPSELIFDDFEELIFADSSLGRNILGSKPVLRKLKRDDITTFVSRTYNTDQIVVSSSANISHERFAELCNKVLANIPANLRTWERKTTERKVVFDIEKSKSTHQVHTLLGGYAYSIHEPQRLAFTLLINILGGASSLSILNQVLREKNALTYGVDACYTPYASEGVWMIYFGCEATKHDKAMELILEQLSILRNTPLTTNKLSRLKRQFIGQLTLASDNSESLLQSIAKSLLTFGEFEDMDSVIHRITEVTPAEIQAVAQDVLDEKNISKLIYR